MEEEYESFDHEFLDPLQTTALNEIKALKAGMRADSFISTMVIHQALVELQRLKRILANWRDDIDSSSSETDLITLDPPMLGERHTSAPIVPPVIQTRSHRTSTGTETHSRSRTPVYKRKSSNASFFRAGSDQSATDEFLPQSDEEIDIPVYLYMKRFYISLVAKFTLYFDKTLSRYETNSSSSIMRRIRNASDVRYSKLIQEFVLRNSSGDRRLCVLLVYQVVHSNRSAPFYHPNGYYCPANAATTEDQDEPYGPLTGLSGWPAILCYPFSKPPVQHWPNIVSLLMEMKNTTKVMCHYEKRPNTTYFYVGLDQNISLVVLFEEKRKLNEKAVLDFVSSLKTGLQHQDVFQRNCHR